MWGELNDEWDHCVEFPSLHVVGARFARRKLEVDVEERVHAGAEEMSVNAPVSVLGEVIGESGNLEECDESDL
jgi:hypothetical protein